MKMTNKKKIISVVGTRPNFIKLAPMAKYFKDIGDVDHLICHTGQHHDYLMSKIFFKDLMIQVPDFYLGAVGGSHAEQTASIMVAFEKLLLVEKPDLIIVYGDVNSTMACSIVASKLNIKIAHIEAGLRSFDRTMPEEINRIITDVLSDYLFVSEKSGLANLENEGIPENKVFYTGNVMIDSLVSNITLFNKLNVLEKYGLTSGEYIVTTLHRPANVDEKEALIRILEFLNETAKQRKIIFPVHPRTMAVMKKWNLVNAINDSRIIISEPLGYIEFLTLIKYAEVVITDSGGIQEETTYLGVPCITFRENTERPITIELGTNVLAGTNIEKLKEITKRMLSESEKKPYIIPDLWDGQTAGRIGEIILKQLFQ
jgi:UDP-N-acetylglucosamine 2-epimerase (non-hydrolysing)